MSLKPSKRSLFIRLHGINILRKICKGFKTFFNASKAEFSFHFFRLIDDWSAKNNYKQETN